MQTQQNREKRPTFMKGMFFIAIVSALVVLLTLAALTQRSSQGPLVATLAPDALSVAVETVTLLDILELDESFSGLILARRTSQLGFPSGGQISRIAVDIGDLIAEGQTLARLDTRNLQANLAAAQASIAEAEANYKLAAATVSRQNTLFEKGHVSPQRVDEAQAQAMAAAARIEAAKAQADTIRVAIDLSVIRAPFAGMITNRMVDEGAIAVPGAPILELVEALQLEARIGLPASAASRLEIGRTYELVSDRGDVEASLRAMTGVIDQNLRTVMTVFDVHDAGQVDAGAVVRIALPRTIDERGFWVPVSALSESSRGLWSIYVAEPAKSGWSAQPRLVEIVHTDGSRAYVRGTVRAGESYILNGLSRLVPGQSVQPVAPPSASATHVNTGR